MILRWYERWREGAPEEMASLKVLEGPQRFVRASEGLSILQRGVKKAGIVSEAAGMASEAAERATEGLKVKGYQQTKKNNNEGEKFIIWWYHRTLWGRCPKL